MQDLIRHREKAGINGDQTGRRPELSEHIHVDSYMFSPAREIP